MRLSEQNVFSKLILLALIILGSLLVSIVISFLAGAFIYGKGLNELGTAFMHLDQAWALSFLKFSQVLQSSFLFIVPAFIFARLVNKDSSCYLRIDEKPVLKNMGLVLLIMTFSLPFVNVTGYWNMQMELPEFLSGLENWMKQKEEGMKMLTESFLVMETPGQFLFNIFMIAILPGIGEELLFRGVLQRLFHDAFKNIHVSIVITSILFSALHMQFYGFLPRFLLGMIFGYLFYWSGNLWYPILAHFLNNATAVVSYYYLGSEFMNGEVNELGAQGISLLGPAISLVIAYLFYKRFYDSHQKVEEEVAN